MNNIVFLAEENCIFSVVVSGIDTLLVANLWWKILNPDAPHPLFTTRIVTQNGKPVISHSGVTIKPQNSIRDVGKIDMLIIPGFMQPVDSISDETKQFLKGLYEKGTKIAAVCTGAFTLAEAGLLDGKIATTNWMLAELFKQRFPNVILKESRILTEDCGLICTGAATSFLDLFLFLIRQYGSWELMLKCSKVLLIDPNRVSQSPYMTFNLRKNHDDAGIRLAQDHLETHFQENISIDSIAERVGMSPRHFKRRFKKSTGDTPISYLQRLRVETAKKQLESTEDTVEEITFAVGYENSNSFRRLFKQYTGLSPKAYRQRFCNRG